MHADPQQLTEAARRGDESALVALIDLLYPRIYAFLRRLTPNDTEAADLTQKTFVRFCKGLASFSGRSSVSSWAHSIAYHTCVDWRRSNHRLESRSPEWWAELVSAEPLPDELASRHDCARTVYASVEQLAPEVRDAIHLHYYQGLTLEETAEAMGVAGSTIKYRLRQGLDALERQLRGEMSVR